jgi:hypothetical protein
MRKLLFSVVLIALLSTFAFTQNNGAEVYIDEYTDVAWVYDGESVILFISTLPDICSSSEDWTARMKIVDNKNKTHWQLTGFYQVYLFDPITPQEFIDAGLCALLEAGDERLVAEGIAKGTWVDHDWDWENTHASWGFGVNGTIYDLTGDCASGMVALNYQERGRWNKGNGFKLNTKGPRYQCYIN